jgi:hypothetical protein
MFWGALVILAVVVQAWRAAYTRGHRDGLREAARLTSEAESLAARSAPRRIGGWRGFPRQPR